MTERGAVLAKRTEVALGPTRGLVVVCPRASGSVWAGCLPFLNLRFLTCKWAKGPPIPGSGAGQWR